MKSIGVVVNPIAGMGGRVGLKGTDGQVDRAHELGGEPRAPDRARAALEALYRHDPTCSIYTAGGVMGADAARAAGFDPTVFTTPLEANTTTDSRTDATPKGEGVEIGDTETHSIESFVGETSADDTKHAVRAFLEEGVDLVLFVGGDGTAVDVATEITSATDEVPMLGVPAGVKIYSSVFGVTPADAGRIAAEFEHSEPREVCDIDEEAYREGTVRTSLQAVVPVPVAPGLQASKQLSSGSVSSLVSGFARDVDAETIYVFGPGGTVGAIEAALEIEATPLGVDVWRDGELLARDADEREILAAMDGPTTIVVSPIGGQGFIFGRGNQQLSPAVIDRATTIEVVASGEKLDAIGDLRVDTDDEQVNEALRGWLQVRTGRFTRRLVRVV